VKSNGKVLLAALFAAFLLFFFSKNKVKNHTFYLLPFGFLNGKIPL